MFHSPFGGIDNRGWFFQRKQSLLFPKAWTLELDIDKRTWHSTASECWRVVSSRSVAVRSWPFSRLFSLALNAHVRLYPTICWMRLPTSHCFHWSPFFETPFTTFTEVVEAISRRILQYACAYVWYGLPVSNYRLPSRRINFSVCADVQSHGYSRPISI